MQRGWSGGGRQGCTWRSAWRGVEPARPPYQQQRPTTTKPHANSTTQPHKQQQPNNPTTQQPNNPTTQQPNNPTTQPNKKGVFGNDARDTGLPVEVFRYYLLANRPETQDTDFKWADLQVRVLL